MKKIPVTIAAALILQLQAYCQSDFDPIWAARFQEVLDSIVLDENVMGAAAAVLAPGEGIWSGISGNSSPEIPLTPEMRFGIGSNTKLFTAVTLLKLQEEGVLLLDDHLYQWLPSYPNVDSTITIRQLLSHKSGIYNYTDRPAFWSAVSADTSHFWTAPEILGYALAPYFEPGTGWHYSNTNYILAAMIIESATGESWVQKVHEFIFDPLDMDSTFVGAFEPANGPIAGFQNWGGTGPWFTYPVTSYWSSSGSAGAILSTPAEMVQWYNALIGGDIITGSSLQQLLDFEPASHYGLGIVGDADESLSYPWYNHGGQVYNFASQIIFDLKTQSVYCIMKTNYPSDGTTLYPLINPMIKVLHNEYPKNQNDAGITKILSPGEHSCTDAVAPQVILKNFGIDPLATASIQYVLDNWAPISYQWTGNLDPGDTVLVSLEPIIPGDGLHKLSVFSSGPNDAADGYPYNDTITMSFMENLLPAATIPYEEDFEDPIFPPQGWISYPDVFTNWGRTAMTSYSGNACAVKCNNWDFNHIGARYNLDLPMIDLTGSNVPTLYFTYAYSCSNASDTLVVLISTDCGSTWQTLFYKGGMQLRTAPVTNNPFFPKSDQWKNETIQLGEFSGNVMIRFQDIEGSSNNLFLDDISVAEAVGLEDAPLPCQTAIYIYPNPTSTAIRIKSNFTGTILILDPAGQEIMHQEILDSNTEMDVSSLKSGIYLVKVVGEKEVQVDKFIKQ